ELRAGRIVILVDEEDRENEGDLVMAAEFVTPEAINFMVTHGRGLVCLTLTEERCRQLDLPLRSEERRVGKECRVRVTPFQAEDGIRDFHVTGVQTCALPISNCAPAASSFWLTKKIAKTKAISSWLPSSSRQRPSTSWLPMAGAWCA